jgi:uncharacterized BrkB/YihY/UPF0761 family membrane protein
VRVVRILIGLLMLAILLALVAFAVWNPGQQLNVKILNQEYERVPFVYTVFLAFLAGVVLTLVFGLLYYFDMAMAMRRTRKEKKLLEAELTALRNLAVEEEPLDTQERERRD